MNRRSFLRLSALGSVALAAPFVWRSSRAAGPYGGPFFALVDASGAWDPRFHFDPIARGDQNRYYDVTSAVGNIPFADYPATAAALGIDPGQELSLLSNRDFLTRHGHRFTVLNGVDTSTNNHEAGSRATWSGRLLGEYPSFGALFAAARAAEQPMSFISTGGYDNTNHLVPLTRVGFPDTLAHIAFPNVMDPTNPDSDRFHTDATYQRIRDAQRARLESIRGRSRLSREQAAIDQLLGARAASGDLSRLSLPADLVDVPGVGDLERLMRGAQIAVAAFRSGVTAAATLTLGGFDTHGNHDQDQPRQITKLWGGIDYLIREAEAAGILSQLYIVVGSDFGRGPLYNSEYGGAGKDHWPVTSMMVAGPGIPGGRVIGATDAGQYARPIDPAALTPADNGVTITPEIVHAALRRVAGIQDFAASYPLTGASVPLFG